MNGEILVQIAYCVFCVVASVAMFRLSWVMRSERKQWEREGEAREAGKATA